MSSGMDEDLPPERLPARPLKGRGAISNPGNRFEQLNVDPRAAHLDELPPDEEMPLPRTQFLTDHTRTILTRNDSPDIPFDVSVNPYRGCEHGCIYCYARPTHEYLGLSAGVDFETKIFVKEDAPKLLRAELMKPSYQPSCISFSGVTDCYQPAERKFRVTRGCLEVLTEFRHPFTVISKNHLVTRDLDVIAPMARDRMAAAFITITTLDADLCAILEPRTSRPAHRLEAVRMLSEAGVPVGVMIAPVIPALTDHEMPALLAAAKRAGARFAGFVPLRLPGAVLPLFDEWLQSHFPDRRAHVLNRIRSMRGGKLNDPNFNSRMQGEGVFADQLRKIFKVLCRKEGLNQEELHLREDLFQRPGEQLKLF